MNIKFKALKDVDLNKIFPVISEDDYALIENMVITLTPDQAKRLESKNSLNMAGYEISASLIDIIHEQGQSQMQVDIQQEVEKKFIFSEDVVDVIIAGVESQRNVLLWGKGGHGKSEITELVLNKLYEQGHIPAKPFIQAFGDGLTEEKLFGGMNIQKYKQEGVIEYLPENSFMNHEIVVFEEIFDAPASVLLSLKDIMTSKKFRQGNEIFDVKTKVVIGLTNRSKREFSDQDDSLAALAERFALTLRVEWNSYSKKNFIKLFKKVYGDKFFEDNKNKLTTLSSIIELNNINGTTFVSPRTAVAAADIFTRGKKLEYISEIDPEIIKKYESDVLNDEKTEQQQKLLEKVESYIESNELEFVDQSEQFLKDLNAVEMEISGKPIEMSVDDQEKNEKQVKVNKCNYLLNILDRQSPTSATFNQFTNTKKRIKGIISSLS